MEKFKQTKRLENIVRLAVVFLVALVCVAVVSFVKLAQVRRENARYDALIESLKEESQNVNQSIEDMTDYDYLEEQARNRLGMIKGDEKHIEFVE